MNPNRGAATTTVRFVFKEIKTGQVTARGLLKVEEENCQRVWCNPQMVLLTDVHQLSLWHNPMGQVQAVAIIGAQAAEGDTLAFVV